jgi:hypothetical protein
MIGTIDFARVFYVGVELTNAARAGAQYGAYNPARSADVPGMEATAAHSGNIDITIVPPTPLRTCECASAGGEGAPVTCSTTCASGQHLVVTVTVAASKNFTTIMKYPGIPRSILLKRTATLRVSE